MKPSLNVRDVATNSRFVFAFRFSFLDFAIAS